MFFQIYNTMELVAAFPDEAALIESFVIACQEMGWDDEWEGLDMAFLDWSTQKPTPDFKPEERRAQERILALAETWSNDHPCWDPELMPTRVNSVDIPDEILRVLQGANVTDD